MLCRVFFKSPVVRRAAGLAAGALFSIAMLSAQIGTAQESTPSPSPTPGIVGEATADLDCVNSGPVGPDGAPVSPAASFAIDSAQSEARYLAEEELTGRGANTAVGRTNAIIGQIYFDGAGTVLTCSGLAVDLRTLQSDESRRDNYLYNNTLEAERFPVATFFLTAVEGLESPLQDGDSADVVFTGDLTIRETTKAVTWVGTVAREGDIYRVSAATEFDMTEFGLTPPTVGPVISIDEMLRLEIDFVAIPATS
jgi:polyisoprenoid-binding protein YceI